MWAKLVRMTPPKRSDIADASEAGIGNPITVQ
jgi:hypothetical protein